MPGSDVYPAVIPGEIELRNPCYFGFSACELYFDLSLLIERKKTTKRKHTERRQPQRRQPQVPCIHPVSTCIEPCAHSMYTRLYWVWLSRERFAVPAVRPRVPPGALESVKVQFSRGSPQGWSCVHIAHNHCTTCLGIVLSDLECTITMYSTT